MSRQIDLESMSLIPGQRMEKNGNVLEVVRLPSFVTSQGLEIKSDTYIEQYRVNSTDGSVQRLSIRNRRANSILAGEVRGWFDTTPKPGSWI
ncbi:hypothetical protein ACFL2C_02945 [Patescibacteria group bacterium]